MSSSSAVATMVPDEMPAAESWNVAVSLALFASSPATSVTGCHALQYAALNVTVPAPCTAMFSSPEIRVTLATTSASGALVRRT